ncbi:hypothetical protein DUNSADRAFT_15314, partial [Dunaliella salina]
MHALQSVGPGQQPACLQQRQAPHLVRSRGKHRRRHACVVSSSDPASLSSSYSSQQHARSSSNSSLQEGEREHQQQAPLPLPPSFLPSMFHTAWREAMEEVRKSSTFPPSSPEQQIQNLQEEVSQLMQGKGLKKRSMGSRAGRKGSDTSSGAPSTNTGNESGRRAAPQEISRPISRWPWISWAMVGWTGVLFWKQ